MAWCCQATSHYLSQCWHSYLSPYCFTRPQWVNLVVCLPPSHYVNQCWVVCWTLRNKLQENKKMYLNISGKDPFYLGVIWVDTFRCSHWWKFCKNDNFPILMSLAKTLLSSGRSSGEWRGWGSLCYKWSWEGYHHMYAVFKISARPLTLTGKTWVALASFPALPYINFGKIVLRSGKFQILFWRLYVFNITSGGGGWGVMWPLVDPLPGSATCWEHKMWAMDIRSCWVRSCSSQLHATCDFLETLLSWSCPVLKLVMIIFDRKGKC